MSGPFPLNATTHPNPSSPSPSPASASTSILISPYPALHLSKVDLKMDEEIVSLTQTSTAPVAPNTSTPTLATSSASIDIPRTPSEKPYPQNMSFTSLNLHAQTLGHSMTQRGGLGSPLKEFGGGQGAQGESIEAKMSPRGFVQPHRSHLPRRVKQKAATITVQATQHLLPSILGLASTLSPAPGAQDPLEQPSQSRSFGEASATTSAQPINNLTPVTIPSDPSFSANLARSDIATPAHSLSATRPERTPLPGSSPLGPNLPRRKSKRVPNLPLSDPPSASATQAPSSTPVRAASPSSIPAPSSRPATPLRSALRAPGKTPLRSAALAASPFVLTSDSESDGEGEGGQRRDRVKVHDRSDSPRTSGAVILGSTPVHTPAPGVPFSSSSVPGPGIFAAVQSGLKKEREKGRRMTFALPFPIHGEPRSPTPPDGQLAEDGANPLPARLAVASSKSVSVASLETKVDRKCTQYVGAGVYVGLLGDDDREDFWEVPGLDADEGMGGACLDPNEKKRLRQIVLRVLSDDEEQRGDVVVDVVENNDEDLSLFGQDADKTALSTEGVESSTTHDQPELPPLPPSPPPSFSSAANGVDHGHKLRQQNVERELFLTLPLPVVVSSKSSEVETARTLAGHGYLDGTSVLSHVQVHQAWKWMRGWMSGPDVEEDAHELEDGEETEGARARSRSRARSVGRKEGETSRSKSRNKSSHRRRRRANIQIEILSPCERRVDAMSLALGYLRLVCAPVGLPVDDLQECLDHEDGSVYTPLHLMWMRLMDVGVRLDDHGDDYGPGPGGSDSGRKRSLSRKRSRSRKRNVSRKRNRSKSQSRPRQVDDVDVDLEVEVGVEMEVGVEIGEEPVNKIDVKLESSKAVSDEVQIERELDPIPVFRFNAENFYPSTSSSVSSVCSHSNPEEDLDLDLCGYTDEDQLSDSCPVSLEHCQQPMKSGAILRSELAQVGEETGEQITLHDIRDEWRGVFSFDGLGKVWESVETFGSE